MTSRQTSNGAGRGHPLRVALVSMPYGPLERPALGLSLLQPAAEAAGFPCRIRYANLEFARDIGPERYNWLAYDQPHTAFAGESTFVEALYGRRRDAYRAYLDQVLVGQWQFDRPAIARLLAIRRRASDFVARLAAEPGWADYDVVGFTSTFEQNIASLALALHLKRRLPRLTVVFGGANWESVMGRELVQRFRFVDCAVSGEGDGVFVELLEALQRRQDPTGVPGVIGRRDGRAARVTPTSRVRDLDQLPLPDFSAYFESLQTLSLQERVAPRLLAETARGCWWGAKSHCTFCGLNGDAMTFRRKSPERAYRELDELSERWQIRQVQLVDNILSMDYFRDLLPRLSARQPRLSLYYEVKSNLSRDQVALLAASGINRVQPGIESLSDEILRLMRKGTTALRNIQMLKWCREYGVGVDWNILYGFPGETRAHYDRMLELLPAIRHLQPPGACGPIRLDRFSPYFERAHDFGLRNVRPIPAYGFLYPFGRRSAERIAYYFDFDYADAVNPQEASTEVLRWAEAWQRDGEPGTLCASLHSDTLVLQDSRSVAVKPRLELRGSERRLYELCDSQQTVRQLIRTLQQRTGVALDPAQTEHWLQNMVRHRVMVSDGNHYLATAIWRPARVPSIRRLPVRHIEAITP